MMNGLSEEVAVADAGLKLITQLCTRAEQAEAMARTALALLDQAEADREWLLDDLMAAEHLMRRVESHIAFYANEMRGAEKVSARLIEQQIGRWRG